MTKNVSFHIIKLSLLQFLCVLLLLAPKQGISQEDSGLPFNEVKVSMSYIPSLANKGDLLGIYRYTNDHDENENLDCGCWVKQTSQGEANAREYSMAHIGNNFWYLYRDNSRCSPNAISGLMGAADPDDPCNPTAIPKVDPYGPLQVTLTDGTTLYVHPETQATGIPWCLDCTDISALANKPGRGAASADLNGENNTSQIVAELGEGNYAAKICTDLIAFGYNDWYLPALGELKAIDEQIGNGGALDNFNTENYFWSSTEQDGVRAWRESFARNIQASAIKTSRAFACRCVRK